MKNFQTTEELMTLEKRRQNHEFDYAFKCVLNVYRFLDGKNMTNHCEILNALYNVAERTTTYEGIACKFNLSDNALRRYRRVYTEWFRYYLELNAKVHIQFSLPKFCAI